jgi:hypothetical protein
MSRPYQRGTGDSAPVCAYCAATTAPGPGYPIDHHADDCELFDLSRDQRERDIAWLLDHPEAAELIRRLDPSEMADLAQFGPPPASRQQRRRWTVTSRLEHRDGRVQLRRWFLLDGRCVAGVIDTAPIGAMR